MTNYNNKPSDRIDTTVTEVVVKGGDDVAESTFAASFVKKQFKDEFGTVLAVWRTGERDKHGWPVFAVEWETKEDA